MLKYLESAPISEISIYDDSKSYLQEGVIYKGSPRKHPYDKDKVIFIPDPLDSITQFYEFRLSNVLHAEDLPSPVDKDGRGYKMMKIWVKRGSYALKSEAFVIK
ncbi:hypothetical protein [Spirochaeta cellobiosiphila]|uniref:hypothetical protein n=1 Tax=Spirochaeta cellobiosiphila TaxID=504483 RepID=UPI00041DBCA6|nr:hypothetical protein [Spirochaeta cellobiosiphila]